MLHSINRQGNKNYVQNETALHTQEHSEIDSPIYGWKYKATGTIIHADEFAN